MQDSRSEAVVRGVMEVATRELEGLVRSNSPPAPYIIAIIVGISETAPRILWGFYLLYWGHFSLLS